MELKNQVVSLELAKRLKELGVEQEIGICDAYYDHRERLFGWNEGEDKPYEGYTKAHNVAELGEIMKGKGMGVTAYASLSSGEWWVRGGEWIVERQQYSHMETGPKWADVLAKMLIYLIENKLIQPPDILKGV